MSDDQLKREVLFKSDLLDKRTLKLSTRLIKAVPLMVINITKNCNGQMRRLFAAMGIQDTDWKKRGQETPGGGGYTRKRA